MKPKRHVDVGSTYEMSGYISKITKTEFVDIRPINTKLDNLKVVNGNILELPYDNSSLESVSCLHVIEHIGLGRYGDEIDPHGLEKSLTELSRILNKNGHLYLSTPIGKERICFNAHRISSAKKIISRLESLDLKLIEFSMVDDNGNFIKKADLEKAENQNYACGLFIFTKQT